MNQWFRLYDELVDDPKVQRIQPPLFRAWINCMCLANKNGGKLPPLDDVAYRLRITRIRAEQYIEELRTIGLIDLIDGEFVPHNWDGRQFKSDSSKDRTKRWRERTRDADSDGERDVTETPSVTHQNRTEQNRAEGVTSRDGSYPPDFEQFWKAYPRHEGKGAALKAWKKIRPSQVLYEAILAAVEKQRRSPQWTRDSGQFIPHAATWLNQSRWDDDPGQAKTASVHNFL